MHITALPLSRFWDSASAASSSASVFIIMVCSNCCVNSRLLIICCPPDMFNCQMAVVSNLSSSYVRFTCPPALTLLSLVCQTNNVSLSLSCPYPRVTLHRFTQSMTGVINLAAETQSVLCSGQHPVRTGTRRVWRLPDSSFMETCCLEDLFRPPQTPHAWIQLTLLTLSKCTLDSGHSSVHKSRNQNTDCKKAVAGLVNSQLCGVSVCMEAYFQYSQIKL